jgi:hypothetical protein
MSDEAEERKQRIVRADRLAASMERLAKWYRQYGRDGLGPPDGIKYMALSVLRELVNDWV